MGGGDVVVVVLRGGGFPCVYLGRVVNIKAPPLSVDGTDQGLIALHLSWEQNIPQRLYRGAAATPLTEWALCGGGRNDSFDLGWQSLLTNVPQFK